MTQRPENPAGDSFVHLHVHSKFSLLDGLSRIPEMTQRVADQGMLAKDDVGYRNLLALTTAAHLDGYYYKPRIDKELLARLPVAGLHEVRGEGPPVT